MRTTRIIVILLCLATSLMGATDAATATWQGGSGLYSDPANWVFAPPVVPARAPCDPTDDVVFADGIYTVTVDTTCTVGTLSLGNNVTLRVENAAIYTSNGQADLFGIVQAVGSQFLAATAAFPDNRARVAAEMGANVVIGATTYTSSGLTGVTTLFSASNGSVFTRYRPAVADRSIFRD